MREERELSHHDVTSALSKIPSTIVAIFSYVVMAGFFTQSGVVLAPAAHFFGRTVPDTASLFSFLVGGNVLGIVASLGVFNVASLRVTFVGAYAVMFGGIILVLTTHVFTLASLGIVLIGFGGGLGLAAGAVIIAKIYAANQRAIAFLGTDCAFSVAGFIFPAVAGLTIARGWGWSSGYAVVALTAAFVLVFASWVRFPIIVPAVAVAAPSRPADARDGAYARIAIIGAALALYLSGQSIFLIWAPSFVQSAFGTSALDASRVVSSFWGPSIFGLITAALLATRLAPRTVLVAATAVTVAALIALATASNAGLFFALTAAFGFSSTCMYKLMISIGSEQLASAPPRLITFLLLSGSIGGTVSPVVSAQVVRIFGPHAGPLMALCCYALAFALILITLVSERSARRIVSTPVTVS